VTPSLPATFATYSQFTSTASADPGGRAIAVYEYGDPDSGDPWQTLAAGADRDSYRRLVGPDGGASAGPYLLSPDGSHVLFFHAGKGTDEFTLQNLTTGQESTRHSVPWVSNVGGIVRSCWPGRRTDGTSPTACLPSPRGPAARATLLWTVTTAGFPLPADADLVSAVPWSPDGTRISVTTGESAYGFVDPRLAQATALTALSGVTLLGWRGPSTVMAYTRDTVTGDDTIVEVSLVDGHGTLLSRVPTQDCCGIFTRPTRSSWPTGCCPPRRCGVAIPTGGCGCHCRAPGWSSRVRSSSSVSGSGWTGGVGSAPAARDGNLRAAQCDLGLMLRATQCLRAKDVAAVWHVARVDRWARQPAPVRRGPGCRAGPKAA
jgi:hypothetical protein